MRKILMFTGFVLLFFPVLAAAQKVNSRLLVSTDWLAKNGDKVVLLHIGATRAGYDAGHIPGAKFVGFGEITTTRGGVPNELASAEDLKKVFTIAGIGDSKRIVLYGEMQGLMAARTFFTLEYLGQGDRVSLLDGGLEKWKLEKREVTTKALMPTPSPFDPKINSSVVIAIDTVRDVSWSVLNQKPSNFSLIDARPPEEYSGKTPGAGITRPGFIPGAVNVFWLANNVVSGENPVMKPVKELRAIYEKAGVSATKMNVVYCRTGGQASHAYFTLRYLGYPVKLYDGSFAEWSKQADTAISLPGK